MATDKQAANPHATLTEVVALKDGATLRHNAERSYAKVFTSTGVHGFSATAADLKGDAVEQALAFAVHAGLADPPAAEPAAPPIVAEASTDAPSAQETSDP